jgi:hypothetical protein
MPPSRDSKQEARMLQTIQMIRINMVLNPLAAARVYNILTRRLYREKGFNLAVSTHTVLVCG